MSSSLPPLRRSPSLINANDSALLLIDLQERILPAMQNPQSLVHSVSKLSSGARILGVPTMITEHYPQGLGPTSPTIGDVIQHSQIFEKRMFSVRQCTELFSVLRNNKTKNIVLAGLEAHICVLQSALDFQEAGFNVMLAVDAIGARHQINYDIALRRMESNGVQLGTVESILIEWCETSEHPEFRQISAILQQSQKHGD